MKIVDLSPLLTAVYIGEVTMLELQNKLDEYIRQVDEGTISLCYEGVPIFKSKYLIPEAYIKHYES